MSSTNKLQFSKIEGARENLISAWSYNREKIYIPCICMQMGSAVAGQTYVMLPSLDRNGAECFTQYNGPK